MVYKIQKVSLIFTKWFFVLVLVLIAAGGAYYLYKNSGYSEYKAALTHLAGLTGSDKANMGDKFFGVWDTPNSYSGILAGSWSRGLWVWGKSGLVYQTLDRNTQFLTIYGCSKNNLVNIVLHQNKAKQFNTKVFSNLGQWRAEVHPGNYVALDITSSNKLGSITAYPEFKASASPWFFCNVTVPEQNSVTM